MPLGAAIFLTLFAATLAQVGTVFLKQATVAEHRKPDDMAGFFLGLARSRRAILGVILQLIGITLYVVGG